MKLFIATALLFALLPFAVLFTIYANQAVRSYRVWKRSGRAMEEGDRQFLELCKVTLMIFLFLKGW